MFSNSLPQRSSFLRFPYFLQESVRSHCPSRCCCPDWSRSAARASCPAGFSSSCWTAAPSAWSLLPKPSAVESHPLYRHQLRQILRHLVALFLLRKTLGKKPCHRLYRPYETGRGGSTGLLKTTVTISIRKKNVKRTKRALTPTIPVFLSFGDSE